MRYLRGYLLVFFGLLGLVGVVNAVMDPYDLLGAPRFHRINDVKSVGDARFVKPLQASARQPHTVFLGTSRVQWSLDPTAFPELDAYNFGIPMGNIAEIAGYYRHAIDDTPARHVVIGLDFSSFNDNVEPMAGFREAIVGPHAFLRALPNTMLSLGALLRSRRTLGESRKVTDNIMRADGFGYFKRDRYPDPERSILDLVADYARSPGFYHGYSGTRHSLEVFNAMLADAESRGVRVHAFVTPDHAALVEAVHMLGLGPTYTDWLRHLAVLCAAHQVPLWSFGGYNRITTTPLARASEAYFDGSHFQPWLGTLMLRTVLAGSPAQPGFGVRLTPDTIDGHLAEQAKARTAWRQANPEDWNKIGRALGALKVAD